MYLIQSNDSFLLRQVCDILNQKNFDFTTDENDLHFARIFLKNKSNNKLILSNDNSQFFFNYPISIKLFTKKLFDLIKKISFIYKNITYFPNGSHFEHENARLDLNEIHNLIFSNCILNAKNGIVKFDLYKKIWPKDKNIFINKLDTHLTNLKKKIESEINLSIGFYTKDGKVFLIIN